MEIVYDIKANTDNATKGINEVEKALKEATKQQEELKNALKTTKDVKEAEKLKKKIDELGKSITALKNRQKELKEANDAAFSKIDSALGGIPGKLKDFAVGLKTITRGFGVLRTAVAATGIGALVIAVTAAVEWFSNFDAAVKITSKVMDGIAGAVNQLGKALDLLLKGDFSGAADAFTDIGNAALQAAENADKLFETTKALQELQARNIPINAKLRQDLELQKKILEDTTLAENERLKALEEVTRISSIIQQNAIEENKLKAQELELKIANENSDEKRRELQIELARVQAELIDQEGQLNIIRKDAEKVEREIISLTQAKRNEQLKEELELQKELKELLKVDDEKDTYLEDLEFADMMADELLAKKEEYLKKVAEGEEFLTKKLEEEQKKQLANDEAAARAKIIYEEEVFKTKVQLANNAANVAAGISELLGQENKNSKTAAIASVLFSQGAALASALRNSQSPTPDNVLSGGLAGIAKFGVIAASIAQTVARVRNIINSAPQVKGFSAPSFGGGGGGSFSGGGGFTPLTPSIVSPTPIQDVNVVNPQSGVRAYVVENDITNSQALTKTLNRRSRL